MRKNDLPAKNFHRLLTYLQTIGIKPADVCQRAGIDYASLSTSTPHNRISFYIYAKLYHTAAELMQHLSAPSPWGAGLGSDSFRMMCYCVISTKTLGEALRRAQEYDRILYPQRRHYISLQTTLSSARLFYHIDIEQSYSTFMPSGELDRAKYSALTHATGLQVWMGLCSWLTGRNVPLRLASFPGHFSKNSKDNTLSKVFTCPISIDANRCFMEFDKDFLDACIIRDTDDLDKSIKIAPYMLWASDKHMISTSAAIKSMMGSDFSKGIPSIDEVATAMHTSASSLRRSLLKEKTNFKALKEQCRYELSINLICHSDLRISEVARRVGYTDASSFTRSFSQWTGLTPKAYRYKERQQHFSAC